MKSSSQGPLLTIQQLSESTGVPVRSLRRWKDSGSIPFYQPGGPNGKLWFPADAIAQVRAHNAGGEITSTVKKELPNRRLKWQQ